MQNFFFESSKVLKEKLRLKIAEDLNCCEDNSLRDILLQRNASSHFIKGVTSYLLHKGLGGKLNEEDLICFCSGLEIFSSGFVVLDNIVDHHLVRNDKTTYLQEYGLEVNALASHYGAQLGMKKMFPFLRNFLSFSEEFYNVHECISGMFRMDIAKPKDLEQCTQAIEMTNGLSLQILLMIAASTASDDIPKILKIGDYAFNTGVAFGIYEELRDLFGEHGRGRGVELQSGRVPLVLFLASKIEPSFNPMKYSGRTLTQIEYRDFMNIIESTGALAGTKRIVYNNLNRGIECLSEIISEPNFSIIQNLSSQISNSTKYLKSN